MQIYIGNEEAFVEFRRGKVKKKTKELRGSLHLPVVEFYFLPYF